MVSIPSIPAGEPAPLDLMSKADIEIELSESNIELPRRWELYSLEQQKDTLRRVRTGEIPNGHKWPTDEGDCSIFNAGFSQ